MGNEKIKVLWVDKDAKKGIGGDLYYFLEKNFDLSITTIEQAEKMINKLEPQLVILEICNNGNSKIGFNFLDKIQKAKNSHLSKIKVMILTGSSYHGDLKKIKSILKGNNRMRFYTKMINRSDLIKELKEWVAK
jgi:hypothetical protein